MKSNVGLPGHDGTMPRPLNRTPPGAKPAREPFVLFREGVDHMVGRFLRGIDNRSVPGSRRALEIIRTLEKKDPALFASRRALPDFPSAPEPIPETLPPPAREKPPALPEPAPFRFPFPPR